MPIELRQQMDLFAHSANGGKSSPGSADVMKKVAIEPPPPAFSGESRYLTALWVPGNEEPSKSPSSDFKLGAALKLLRFREHRVIIQFWLPVGHGKHKLLTTADQPFGLGAIDDEGLQSYRKHSVDSPVVVVKHLEERDPSPVARVFRRRLPEWTFDITNYSRRDFAQQEFAIRCNFRGYMALPVFHSTAGLLCVGVLELLTSSKYNSYAFEVQQVHKALEMANLTSPQAFDYPALDVHNEHKQNELEKILRFLKEVCSIHKLPLAQTWAVSPFSSFACHEQNLEKTCNSFDIKCLKKVCMSTAALPFHVQDLSKWDFRKACKEQHLEKSKGVAGRAMLSHGSCFCADVTKLSKDEYPLVYKARMSRLSSCFATFLHSIEFDNDYVLEFFLPLDMEDGRGLPNLVHILKKNIELASGFELGDMSCIQIVGPPLDVSFLSLNTHPHTIQISSNATSRSNILEMISSDSELMVTNTVKTESANLLNQWSLEQNDSNNYSDKTTATENLTVDLIRGDVNVSAARQYDNTTSYPDVSMMKKSDMITDAQDKRNSLKQGRKRKIDSLTMEAVQQHLGKPIDEAAKSLNVSRSTLKRFCREHNIQSWPLPKHNKKAAANVTNLKLPQESWSEQQLQPPTNVLSSIHVVVFLLLIVKRWSCSGKRHGFSGRWWRCGKHSYLPAKSDYIYRVARLKVHSRRWRNKISVRHAVKKRDQPTVSESTSKPEYTTNIINSYSHFDWQLPEPIIVHASPKQKEANYIYLVARLKVQLRRWRNKISIRHALQKRGHPTMSESTSKPEYTTNIRNPYSHFDWQLPEPILVHASPKQNGADYIYRVAHLMVQLIRWRNKISVRHASQRRHHPAVSERTSKPKYTTNITKLYSHFDSQLPGPILVPASPKQNVSDIRMVKVKATYKDDIIKFQLPTSSGLSELENQVAQRINLESRGFRLKYMDEDNDLILLACDADVSNLLRFSGSNGTLKLFVTKVDD